MKSCVRPSRRSCIDQSWSFAAMGTWCFAKVEVAAGNDADRRADVKRHCEADSRRPFDLAQGPLVRATLYRLSSIEHVLLVTAHHIVFDGWSISVFLKELASIYTAFSEGRPSTLPDLPIQYSDFAHSQRQSLKGEVLDELIAFWRKKLEGIPPHLALPFDHAVQTGRNYRGRDIRSFWMRS